MNVIIVSMQENLCTFGARYVYYAVRKDGHRAVIFYPNLQSEIADESGYAGFIREFIHYLKVNNIEVVGISFMSYQSALVKKICSDVKKEIPQILLAGGGFHTSGFPKESLAYFDAVCLGEGEICFTDFLKQYERKRSLKDINIPAMMTSVNSGLGRGQIPLLLRDMDSLAILPVVDRDAFFYRSGKFNPICDRHIGKFQRYNGNGYDISTSRGCPLECAYCADSINRGLYGGDWKMIRLRSVDHVMEELRQAVRARPTIRFINFHDDSFTSRPLRWLADFVPRYLREIKLPLMFRMIPGSVDAEKYRLLSRLPVIAAGIGLQSGSYRVLSEVYNRPVKILTFTETIRRLNELRIMPIIDVMLNNPYEYPQDVAQTIEVLSSLPRPFLLELYGFRFYPGTEMTARALKDGVIKECDMYQTQSTIDTDSQKQVLNNIIYIAGHFPRKLIKALVSSQNDKWVKAVLPSLVIAGSIMNAFFFLFMIIRSHRYNPFRVVRFLYFTLDPVVSVCHVFPFLRHLVARK